MHAEDYIAEVLCMHYRALEQGDSVIGTQCMQWAYVAVDIGIQCRLVVLQNFLKLD